jgi:uncharacterized membrane protein
VFMVDKRVADISPAAAVGVGVGTLVAGWLIYHNACKTRLTERPALFAVLMFAGACAVAYGLTEVLSPRAAYIHVGALLGTCMALNVFYVIIPNQRVMVNAMIEGHEPDARKGRDGALRSLHNNYMTLPVLFIMVSNHFPMTYGHRWDWGILAAISVIGGGVRHWFNLRGRGLANPFIWPAAAAGMLALAFVLSPYAQAKLRGQVAEREQAVGFDEANQIIMTRCTPCHAAKPTFAGMVAAPKGVVFETPEQIKAQIPAIQKFTIDTFTMPLGNLTQMTDEERALLGQWIREGAPLD